MTVRTILTTICERCNNEHQVAIIGTSFSLPHNWAQLQIKEQKSYSSDPSTIHLCPDCNNELWNNFLTNKKAAQVGGESKGPGT